MEARSGGHEFYGDIFEIASILLQTYAFDELMQGIAEGISSIGDKIRSTDYSPMKSKKGGAYVGGGNNEGLSNNDGYSNASSYYRKGRPEGGNPRVDTLVRKDKLKAKRLKIF